MYVTESFARKQSDVQKWKYYYSFEKRSGSVLDYFVSVRTVCKLYLVIPLVGHMISLILYYQHFEYRISRMDQFLEDELIINLTTPGLRCNSFQLTTYHTHVAWDVGCTAS
jgi:hypothetical protein